MRVPKSGFRELNSKYPLEPVSRGHQSNGREQFMPPKAVDTRRNWDMLRTYLNSVDDVLDELKPMVQKIATKNTVIGTLNVKAQNRRLLWKIHGCSLYYLPIQRFFGTR
jgi:hypothetical protein